MKLDPDWALAYSLSLLMAACMGIRLARGDYLAASLDLALALVVPLSGWHAAGARTR
jgi:hypothetical protein